MTYYDKASIDWLCFGKKANLDDVYDPFRDAHSALFHSDDSDNAISYDDYPGYSGFPSFSLLDNQAVATPCFYQDPKKNKQIALQLMGWYYHGQQLKINWKPDNQHNARWRSSVVAIDRKTRRYFFKEIFIKKKELTPSFRESFI